MMSSNEGPEETNPYLSGQNKPQFNFRNPFKDENSKITLIVVVVIVVILGLVFANSNSSSTQSDYSQSEVSDWQPAGFNLYSSDFATRWKQDTNVSCDGCLFWNLQVVPKYDCNDGIEASLKVTYASDGSLFGNVYAEESYFVPSGQTVDLIFKAYPKDTFKDFSGEVVYIGCR